MKIAWIDDDIEIIEPVVKPLKQDGHKITPIRTIGDALDAIEFLRTCDLILLDTILPPGDCDEDLGYYSGASLLRKLREEYKITTPVVIFSVVVPSKIKEQLESLYADYVLKPALPSELKEVVDTVLAAQQRNSDAGE